MPRHSVKRRNPFAKAIALAIGLAIALFLYYKVKTGNIVEVFLAMFEDTMTTPTEQSKFTEREMDSLLELASGFWVYKSDTTDPVTIVDMLEITDNGYIWQVEEVQFTLPSGNRKKITHVFHGFFYPSSKAIPDTTYVNSVVRSLPQMWIYGDDTCTITKYYGGNRSQQVIENAFADLIVENYRDDAVDVFLGERVFKMKNRDYAPYEEEDIRNFFPQGLVDKVYNLSTAHDVKKDKMYSIEKKEVILNKGAKTKEVIKVHSVKECIDCFSRRDFLRKAIAEDLQKTKVTERKLDDVTLLMKKYYIPYCLKEKTDFTIYERDRKPLQVDFSFDLTWEGKTENVIVQMEGRTIGRKWIEKDLTMEIEKWKFQPLKNESPPVTVTFTEEI